MNIELLLFSVDEFLCPKPVILEQLDSRITIAALRPLVIFENTSKED